MVRINKYEYMTYVGCKMDQNKSCTQWNEVSNVRANDDLCTNFGSNYILLYHSAFEADIHHCNIKLIKQSDK